MLDPALLIPVISAVTLALVGGSLAVLRRSLRSARKEGERREGSRSKIDAILTSLSEGRLEVKEIKVEVQAVKSITQGNAVSISRLEGKVEAYHRANGGGD